MLDYTILDDEQVDGAEGEEGVEGEEKPEGVEGEEAAEEPAKDEEQV